MVRVLIVEDERAIATVVRDYLVDAGFEATIVGDADGAIREARATSYDAVIADIGLPGLRDGLDVVRDLRRRTDVPIVLLTARGEEADRLVGLELGADDYITKPFSPREVVARVKAVLRRGELGRADTTGARTARPGESVADAPQVVTVGLVALDPARRRVTRADEEVALTTTEFDLLAVLMAAPGRVFSRAQLQEALHGVAVPTGDRAIDAHVKNVRRKLGAQHIETVIGVGYRFAEDGGAG